MNQSFIINDDYSFDKNSIRWICSAMLAGSKVTICIESNVSENELTQDIKFDWECIIEEWLDENEPDINDRISIKVS